MNCRPITYEYNDEFSEPFTASHLIYGYRILLTKSINDQNLLEHEKFSTSNLFKRIYTNYQNHIGINGLNELREHHTTGKNVNSLIKLGNIVFIHNHNAKRNV